MDASYFDAFAVKIREKICANPCKYRISTNDADVRSCLSNASLLFATPPPLKTVRAQKQREIRRADETIWHGEGREKVGAKLFNGVASPSYDVVTYMYEAALVDGSFAFLPSRRAAFFFNFCFSPSRLRCPQALQHINCDCQLSTAKLGAILCYTILHAVLLLQLFLH